MPSSNVFLIPTITLLYSNRIFNFWSHISVQTLLVLGCLRFSAGFPKCLSTGVTRLKGEKPAYGYSSLTNSWVVVPPNILAIWCMVHWILDDGQHGVQPGCAHSLPVNPLMCACYSSCCLSTTLTNIVWWLILSGTSWFVWNQLNLTVLCVYHRKF